MGMGTLILIMPVELLAFVRGCTMETDANTCRLATRTKTAMDQKDRASVRSWITQYFQIGSLACSESFVEAWMKSVLVRHCFCNQGWFGEQCELKSEDLNWDRSNFTKIDLDGPVLYWRY